MLADLRRVNIFLARHVTGFFEQRHIDHRGGVALRAWIAVPVPGAAKVAAFFDNADAFDARLFQPRADDETGKATADEGERDMVGHGRALLPGRVRVCRERVEIAFEAAILRIPISP